MSKNYVIVGGGTAAVTAAKTIRDNDGTGIIKVFAKENWLPYNRMHLSKQLFSDLESAEHLLKTQSWYEKHNIQFFSDIKITQIDPEQKVILTSKDEQVSYDELLLCIGAVNCKLPVPGADKQGVFCIREMEDALKCKAFIADKEHTVVIGGGVQGLEIAWSFWQAGKKVSIIEAAERLMPRQLDEKASLIVKEKIEEIGVSVYLNASIEQITGDDKVNGISINGGKFISCDSVIYSIGIEPNIELATTAGIKTNKGIITDETMATNVANIYAAGDVVEFNGKPEGLWASANEQGKVAGLNMAGIRTSYNRPLPVTVFRAFDLDLFSIGIVDEEQIDLSIIDDQKNYRRVFIKDQKLVGVVSLEGVTRIGTYTLAIENKTSLDEIDLANIDITELLERLSSPEDSMEKYVCKPCGYIYDPVKGDPDEDIEPGTAFEDLPDDWVCPICGMGKDHFAEI